MFTIHPSKKPCSRLTFKVDCANGLDAAQALALTAMLVALWSLCHVYRGLTGDAELYALQALARLQPALHSDLYLRNVSQDRFTIFSPIYSWFINRLGLQPAALTLTLTISAWFLLAAWILARELSNSAVAFLSTASLIVIKGAYGSSGVFAYAENWLTARTLAEALIVTALACHFASKKRMALLIATGAMFIHPIMALPGLLLLLVLWLPLRVTVVGAFAATVGTLALALCASRLPTSGPLAIMDADWLEVVRERSQFLFLQYWTLQDWAINARPFLCLLISALVLDGHIRKFAVAALIIGTAGLAVAGIASLVGPVAILLQGQAWRWLWLTCFVSVLLLVPTAVKMWNDEKCGPSCSMLLILGWTFSLTSSSLCIPLVLLLWLVKDRLSETSSRCLKWGAAGLAIIVTVWIVANAWTTINAPSPESGRDTLIIADLRNLIGLDAAAALIVVVMYFLVRSTASLLVLAPLATLFAVGAAFALHGSVMQINLDGSAALIREFAGWRNAIPPRGTVYVVPARISAAFAWFTLERPSYLSLDQSAGVVFSRATALEVRRRSQLLLPSMAADWRLLSQNRTPASAQAADKAPPQVTSESLARLCSDPQLDFVVTKEQLNFKSLRHTAAGKWHDFGLYDCRDVRPAQGHPA